MWHLIDYVIVRKHDLKNICNVRSFHESEFWTAVLMLDWNSCCWLRSNLREVAPILLNRLNISKVGRSKSYTGTGRKISILGLFQRHNVKVFCGCCVLNIGFSQNRFHKNNETIKHLLTLKKNSDTLTLKPIFWLRKAWS